MARGESEIEYHLAYSIFTNRAENTYGFPFMHLSEIELFFPGNVNGRKTKGLHHHPDETGSIHPPPLDVTVNSFPRGRSLWRCIGIKILRGRQLRLPRILSSDPPPFVSLSPPPCFSSLPPPIRKEFVITRRIVRGKLGQPLRGITPGKVGTIGEGKTYKQISLPPVTIRPRSFSSSSSSFFPSFLPTKNLISVISRFGWRGRSPRRRVNHGSTLVNNRPPFTHRWEIMVKLKKNAFLPLPSPSPSGKVIFIRR